jgi:pimeloyl-ACP methyl ester carboxylesterase
MIFLLPGMGANHKMYTESEGWNEVKDAVFLDWLGYNGEATFAEVAQRLIKEHKITPADYVGGSSLGGMIAIEIEKILNNPKVVLLGSAINKSEVNSLLMNLSPIAEITPLKLLELFTDNIRNKLVEMFTGIDTDFIKAMCLAINKWGGCSCPPGKLIRIHGEKDMVIKCPKKCFSIADGGHLIAMTHPKECISFIKENLRLTDKAM